MILQTPKLHFDEDIQRAKVILNHMNTLNNGMLKNEISRLAWMTAVGSLDAYFCDAYGDLISRTLRAKQKEPTIDIKNRLENLMVPAVVLLRPTIGDGWRWRMVARDIIEKDNVLSLTKIKELFNQFFANNQKLFNNKSVLLDDWILHRDSTFRFFGITKTDFRRTAPNQKNAVRERVINHVEERFELIFQRRHDCIHNCDRPKYAIHEYHLGYDYVKKVIADVEFLVNRIHIDLINRFPQYLAELGFSPLTRNSVGC